LRDHLSLRQVVVSNVTDTGHDAGASAGIDTRARRAGTSAGGRDIVRARYVGVRRAGWFRARRYHRRRQ
jgi:hypothetical protein